MISSAALGGCWYVVATTDAVTTEPVPVTVRDSDYVLWRGPGGALIAAPDQCTHREARLSNGRTDAGCLTCPYHGWSFGEEGRCVDVPSSGSGAAIPPTAHLATVVVDERYGLVWLCPEEPTQPIPHLAVDADDAFTRLNTDVQIWECSATRMIDNMLDVAHFPYTHAGTFGLEQEAEVPRFSLTDLDDTFHGYEYSVTINNEGDVEAMSGGGADVIQLDMTTGFTLPFSVRSTMSYDNGIEQILFMTATPISTERAYYTFVLWRNDDVTETGQDIVDFELAVTAEDREMLEQLRGELPLDRGALVDVASDRASVEWRRRYRALVAGA
ncbi:MAG: aromatic ring-hydroxylating dioxygenase subunit alpha [Actinomycetota bacterium]